MLLQIAGHAAAELLGPDPQLEHADHRRALLVGDGVEGGGDVALTLDRLADAAGGEQPILAHGVVRLAHALGGLSPRRVEGLHRLRAHPVGECLVEPEIVPPGHGHHVAEPEVRELVRFHRRGADLELG